MTGTLAGVILTETASHDYMQGKQGTAVSRTLIFVLGMGRSGTSALTRTLALCGATLPVGMVGASRGNPTGFWEPRKVVVINRTILLRHDSGWYDPSIRDSMYDAHDIADIRKFLTGLPTAPIVVIKDPWLTALAEGWFEAARQVGFAIAPVIAVRHPQEVIDSLGAHGEVSPELSGALWLKYNLLAERCTRGIPRVFVNYANLLDDWRREVTRISAALGLDLNAEDEGIIDEFLTPDLRRQQHCGPAPRILDTDWVPDVYNELQAASRDDFWSPSVLDNAFGAYRTRETGFRIALEDCRRLHRTERFSRPWLTRLLLESAALIHRRQGAWA